MRLFFSPKFLRMVGATPKDLQEDVYEKVEAFRDRANHQTLKVHKLQGKLKGLSSFSVNYQTRIIFEFVDDGAVLHAVGDHDVYNE